MPANTAPIFSLTPIVTFLGVQTTGNNDYIGTNAAVTLMYTAGASGSFVRMIVAEAAGTNGVTALRVWINNGATNGTASNNSLAFQFSLPATTASASTATAHIEIPLNIQLPATYRLYGVLSQTVAAGWTFSTHGGDY